MIEHSQLLKLVDYDPLTGVFTRKVTTSPQAIAGQVAGNLTRGYIELSVNGQVYRGHPLAWFYVHGEWPSGRLDHKDLNKANNAISNLRLATSSQNGGNCRARKTNTSGFKGVVTHGKRFKSAVMVDRKRIHLGVFNTPEEAAEAYDAAAVKYFGEFALTNRQLGHY